MIKFFRKIRQKLLVENRFKKYLLYAIGEIILVVIGILIALQINNWNQNRLEAKERVILINNLNEEFQLNRTQLIDIIAKYEKAKNYAMKLMEFVGQEEHKGHKKQEIDSLMDGLFPSVDFLYSDNAIQDIIQSGKLKVLKNVQLSNKLSEWKTINNIIFSREEKLEKWVFNQMLPYLNKHISWRDVGVENNYNWSTKGKIPVDYASFLTDLEFENLLENDLYFLNEALVRYKESIVILEELIKLTSNND